MPASRETFNRAMKEGRAQAWAMNWAAAAEQYRRALHEFPDDLVARNSLAVTLYRAGNWAEALREYELVSRLNPSDSVARARIAELYYRLGDEESAGRAYVSLGEWLLQQRDREKALEAWSKAVELCSNSPVVLRMVSRAAGLAGERSFQAEVEARLSAVEAEAAALAMAVKDASESAERGATIESERQSEAQARLVSSSTTADREGQGQAVSDADGSTHDLLEDIEWGEGWRGELARLDAATRGRVIVGLTSAKRYVEQGLLCAAEDEYLGLVALAPGCLLAQEGLAQVYARQSLDDEALDKYSWLASIYELRGEYGRAAQMYLCMVDLDGKGLDYRSKAASLLLRANRPGEAQAELLAVAEGYLTQGLVDASLEAFNQAVSVDPNNAEARIRLGRALEGLSRYEEAALQFRRALEIDPANTDTLTALSVQLGAIGDWDGMEAVFSTVVERAGQDNAFLATAVSRYEQAATRLGGNPNLSYCAGVLLRLAGRREQSRSHLTQAAVGEGRRTILSRLYLGEESVQAGDLDGAVDHLNRGLSLCSTRGDGKSDPEVLSLELRFRRLLADAFLAKRDWDSAKAALREVKRLVPADDTTYARLAEIHFRLGEVPAAIEQLSELAQLYFGAGRTQEAAATYQAALQLDPDNLRVRAELADVYLRVEDWRAALAELETLADRQLDRGLKDEGYATLRKLLDHSRSRDPRLALAVRERMARLRPDDCELRQELIEAYLKAGRPSQALDEARAVAELSLKRGQVSNAVVALRKVVTLNPWDARALAQLGDALCLLGDEEEAAKVYERLLAIDPNSKQAKSALAAIRQSR